MNLLEHDPARGPSPIPPETPEARLGTERTQTGRDGKTEEARHWGWSLLMLRPEAKDPPSRSFRPTEDQSAQRMELALLPDPNVFIRPSSRRADDGRVPRQVLPGNSRIFETSAIQLVVPADGGYPLGRPSGGIAPVHPTAERRHVGRTIRDLRVRRTLGGGVETRDRQISRQTLGQSILALRLPSPCRPLGYRPVLSAGGHYSSMGAGEHPHFHDPLYAASARAAGSRRAS